MNMKLASALIALGVSSVALGQSVSFVGSTPFFFPPADVSDSYLPLGTPGVIPVSRWNPANYPAGSFLVGVSYEISLYSSGSYNLFSPASATAILFNSDVDVTGPFLGSPAFLNQNVNFSIPVTAGTGFVSAGPFSAGPLSDNGNLLAYQGPGSVVFGIVGSGEAGLVALNNVDGILNPGIAGVVRVTYEYRIPEVPEASTYAAVGFLAALGGWSVYRRRNA